jgi:hypothetical protein
MTQARGLPRTLPLERNGLAPGGAKKRFVVNPTLGLRSAEFQLRVRSEGGAETLSFHPGLEGDWRDLLRAILMASDAKPGTSREALERRGIASDVLAYLVQIGVLVEPEDVPADVSFSCELGRVRPRPTVETHLEMNSDIYIQTGATIPAPLSERVLFTGALTTRRPIVWVDDRGTGIPMPFSVTGRIEKVLGDLLEERLSPARVPQPWRSVFEQATILVPRDYAEKRRKHWQAQCEQAAEALRTKEHAILRGLFNPLQLQALQRYMRALRSEGYLRKDGTQVEERVVRHNEPMARLFHAPLGDLISRFTPERTKPSYCFAAHYQPGARLERHTDREQCVWNVSVAVDSTPESTSETAWPLFIESRGTPYPVRLAPGDGVLYGGTNNPHWRDAQPDRHVSTFIFYHFVPLDFSGDLD